MLKPYKLVLLLIVFVVALSACGPAATTEAPSPTDLPAATPAPADTSEATEFTFGLLMVGPYNDHGWSQAHYEAGLYVEKNVPGAKMVYVDKVNPADRPGTTPAQLAEDLVSKGAQLVIFNSDDMKDSATEFAKAHTDVNVIMASGDQVWKDGKAYIDLPNMTNIMGRMEYGKMIAGCAAALSTQTGQIGYLGPLINDETRRLAASAYLGAKYCWTNYLGKDAKDLKFKITWIGFWFNIPGVTSDPTQVADEFFNNGYDVVLSGIDTTEAISEAKKFAGEGKKVFAIPYDYIGACEEGKEVCLGVPYFNWGPDYAATIKSAAQGSWTSQFLWSSPDWSDINNPDTSAVGFVKGSALPADAASNVDKFIAELAGGLNLWAGPLNLQDGSVYLKDGETATDQQVWYLPQLIEGMEGQSVSE
jgi:simple sugar transport system substrate-binding protein